MEGGRAWSACDRSAITPLRPTPCLHARRSNTPRTRPPPQRRPASRLPGKLCELGRLSSIFLTLGLHSGVGAPWSNLGAFPQFSLPSGSTVASECRGRRRRTWSASAAGTWGPATVRYGPGVQRRDLEIGQPTSIRGRRSCPGAPPGCRTPLGNSIACANRCWRTANRTHDQHGRGTSLH